MRKNILFIKTPNKNWFEISKKIRNKFSFNKIYWITNRDENQRNFLSNEDIMLINESILSKKKINTSEIDFGALEFLSQYQEICNELLDRNLYNFQNVYYENRRRYLINLFDFCLKILIDYEIETVISRRAPHRLIDYMIYLACQYKKKNFLYFDLTTEILPKLNQNKFEMMTYISNNKIEDKTKNIFTTNNKRSHYKLNRDLSKIYIKKLRSFKNGFIPDYSAANYNRLSIEFYFKKYAPTYFIYCIYFFKSFFIAPKEFKLKIDFDNKNLNFKKASSFETYKDNINLEKNVINYKKLYDLECIKFEEIRQNYIFLPLGRDREKNSCPDGEELRDISNILDYLIKYLPKNFLILVKDHPGNFRETSLTNTNRSAEFFNMLKNKSNRVKLVNVLENSNEILKKSKGVVCLNGTLAWEAIIKNIPSCIFGTSWYQDCNEIIKINKPDDFQKFIYKLNQDKKINLNNIEDFLSKIYMNCIPENFDKFKKIKKTHLHYILNAIKKKI